MSLDSHRSGDIYFLFFVLEISTFDSIKTKHNSNHKTQQATLEGELTQDYSYYVLGFVPANVIRLNNDVWFSKLYSEQISLIEKYLAETSYV